MQEQGLIQHYSELFKEWIILENSNFLQLQNKIDLLLKWLELENKSIILATSWWADSMLVAILILYFYQKNKLNLSNIHIAHCNHKIRQESEIEAKFMMKFFSGLNIYIYERDKKLAEDENSLRNRRYSQFSSLQKSTKSSYIFLGHHLNDRVESTFLNLMRWAGINGFVNMRRIEKHHLLPEECKVCRPLLETSKCKVLNICDEVWIPFFEDKTNLDDSVSKRNWVRNQILNPISKYWTTNWEENKFLESFSNIYSQLENFENKEWNNLIKLPSIPLWNANFSYLWNNDILKCNENDVFDLFHILNIQISFDIVKEWTRWMNKWENWYKYIWWVYFFIHEKQLFILKANKEFWVRKNNDDENLELEIKSMDYIKFFEFDLNIPRDELIWGKVRLPKEWDIFWWKHWKRRALNQKIPMRRRDWIPLAIKDGKVIHMWKNIRK